LDFTKTTHNDTYPAVDPTKSDHSGRIIFITGASMGLGKATAISYAKTGAEGIILGARSDLSAVEADVIEAAKAAGKKVPKILKLKVDVTDQASVDESAKAVEKEFGRLDILINNAGYLSSWVSVVESDPLDWWTNWEANIKGVYLMTRAHLPLMLKGGEKTIVNLSSIGAHLVTPGASGYQTTKFALLRLTEAISADYVEQGLLTYCIHPGGVMTDMGNKLPTALHSRKWSSFSVIDFC
jgi:NAD(P)-dependent dehydrogenase (short-subunit alcohol dehydrogenase family)